MSPVPKDPLPPSISDPVKITHAAAPPPHHPPQRAAVARPADTVPARGAVGGAMCRTKQIASFGIEKYPFLPVEFHRDMGAAVQICMDRAAVADGERGRRLAEVFNLEAHALPRIGQRERFADHPC